MWKAKLEETATKKVLKWNKRMFLKWLEWVVRGIGCMKRYMNVTETRNEICKRFSQWRWRQNYSKRTDTKTDNKHIENFVRSGNLICSSIGRSLPAVWSEALLHLCINIRSNRGLPGSWNVAIGSRCPTQWEPKIVSFRSYFDETTPKSNAKVFLNVSLPPVRETIKPISCLIARRGKNT